MPTKIPEYKNGTKDIQKTRLKPHHVQTLLGKRRSPGTIASGKPHKTSKLAGHPGGRKQKIQLSPCHRASTVIEARKYIAREGHTRIPSRTPLHGPEIGKKAGREIKYWLLTIYTEGSECVYKRKIYSNSGEDREKDKHACRHTITIHPQSAMTEYCSIHVVASVCVCV